MENAAELLTRRVPLWVPPLVLGSAFALLAAGMSALVPAPSGDPWSNGAIAAAFGCGGAYAGALWSAHLWCSRNPKYDAFGYLAPATAIASLLGLIAAAAWTEVGPGSPERAGIAKFGAVTAAWWLLAIAGAAGLHRKRAFGKAASFLAWVFPLLVLGFVLIIELGFAPVEPGSFWSQWPGVRAVAATLVLPIGGLMALVFLIKMTSDTWIVLAASALFLAAAAVGELVGRLVGFPVLGAYAGALALLCVPAILRRK